MTIAASARIPGPPLWVVAWLACAAVLLPAGAAEPPPSPQLPSPSRGQLLYGAHCVGCHTSQVHWRDQRLASDWPRLQALVNQWQQRLRLDWSRDDVVEVARHLNDTIYRHPRPTERGDLVSPPPVAVAHPDARAR